jgi:hypothetical protein
MAPILAIPSGLTLSMSLTPCDHVDFSVQTQQSGSQLIHNTVAIILASSAMAFTGAQYIEASHSVFNDFSNGECYLRYLLLYANLVVRWARREGRTRAEGAQGVGGMQGSAGAQGAGGTL